MAKDEKPKVFSKEQSLERGIQTDDAAQAVGGVVAMLKQYPREPFSGILQVAAVKIETEYGYKEYEDMGGATVKPDAIALSGREAVKMIARALKKLNERYTLLEQEAPENERHMVRRELIAELESLRKAIHEKRAEWLTELLADKKL